jgi:hypothetical protein
MRTTVEVVLRFSGRIVLSGRRVPLGGTMRAEKEPPATRPQLRLGHSAWRVFRLCDIWLVPLELSHPVATIRPRPWWNGVQSERHRPDQKEDR